jgi:hypothetical protein
VTGDRFSLCCIGCDIGILLMVAPSGPKAQATSPMSIELQGTLLHSDVVISYRSSPCCIGEIVTLATCASCTLWISDIRDIPCVFCDAEYPYILVTGCLARPMSPTSSGPFCCPWWKLQDARECRSNLSSGMNNAFLVSVLFRRHPTADARKVHVRGH